MKLISIISITLLFSCKHQGLQNFQPVSSELLERINSDEETTNQAVACEQPKPDLGEATVLTETIMDFSCEVKCPQNYRALPGNKGKLNFLAFKTPGHLGIGRCRGHAIVTQNFNMLAIFKKQSNYQGCNIKGLSSSCLNFYKEIIEDITIGKVVREIPGFDNLLEFSSHPDIYPILYSKVISYRHTFTAGNGHLQSGESSHPSAYYEEIKLRVNKRQTPYIGIRGPGQGHHAVLATETRRVGKSEIICISDPNQRVYNPYRPENCQNYLQKKTGIVTYHRADGRSIPLTKLNLYTDEDQRTVNYVNAWKKFCQNNLSANGDCFQNTQKKEVALHDLLAEGNDPED